MARGPDGAQLMLPDAVAARLRDQRRPQGVRHGLASLVSVLVAGVACGHRSPLAIVKAAAGWGQEVLAGHGCRISPVTGRRCRRRRRRWTGSAITWIPMSWRRR